MVCSKDQLDLHIGNGPEFFFSPLFEAERVYLSRLTGKTRNSPDSAWSSQLITSSQIRRLYDNHPLEIYGSLVDPISFQRTGWFRELIDLYRSFEICHRQAIWEATHFLPITTKRRRSDPALATIGKERSQRRSRAGPRWKKNTPADSSRYD